MTDLRAAGIVLVPHMHWDREWYEPFQVFRFRLVQAVDSVLEAAERDPQFRFTLDGQSAAIEDYLEIRPENRDRIRAVVTSGQLAIGPWLILLDEFLCTGETIVRNLQLGYRVAESLGGAMQLGYLPDMFGHVAQMPQILVRAGISHSALWRGVPSRVRGHAFWWVSPDGSKVRTEYLFDGYGNGLDLLLVPDQIPRALQDYRSMTEERWGNDAVLGMAGTDHTAPDSRLMDWVREYDKQPYSIRIATLPDYVAGCVHNSGLPTVVGELRSHSRGNILPGVLSIRVGLKEAMARAERILGEAECLSAHWSTTDFTPFIERAWRKIIESSAHDSVVGSGTDETVDQVAARLAEAGQIARAVRDGIMDDHAASVPSGSFLVANTLTHDRTVVIDVEVAAPLVDMPIVALDGNGISLPLQEIDSAPVVLADERMAASSVERVLRRIHRRELFGQNIETYEITPGCLVLNIAEVPQTPEFDLFRLRQSLAQATTEFPGQWRVLTIARPRRRVIVAVDMAPSSLAAITVQQNPREEVPRISDPCRVEGRTLTNGLVSATVTEDGTIEITGADGTVLKGVGRLVDGGDRGDSYNYGPPAHDVMIAAPTSVDVAAIEFGPVRAIFRVRRNYMIPVALSEDHDYRSEDAVDTGTETLVEVRLNEPFVRVSVSLVNQSSNHRLRVHIPLPSPITTSAAEGQFAVTERGLCAEGGWGEAPIPTFPATSFVSAGSATVLLDHATEYEVTAQGSELALTLLRCVGAISVNLHPLRDEPAANEIAIPGGQELGRAVCARFAIIPSASGWAAGAVREAEHFRHDPIVRRGTARSDGGIPATRVGISVDGPNVSVSSVRPVPDGVEVRMVAMADEPVVARVGGQFTSIETVDLLGRKLSASPAPGHVDLDLRPWEIRTIVLH